MSEYSQEERERLATEVKSHLHRAMDQAREIADILEWMAEHFQPGQDYDGLRRQHAVGWLLELNHYEEVTLDATDIVKAMVACNDEHSGLLWEREHPEEVAS